MELLKKILFTLLILKSLTFASSYNSNLSSSEKESLSKGETLIKNTGSYKKMCLDSENPYTKQLSEVIGTLKPTYFAEVIKEYPYEGNENLLDDFSELVMDVPSYAGIPYYSERAEKWYDLYSSAEIKSVETTENTKKIEADFEMSPFGDVPMQIISEKTDSYFYYESTNLSTMRYRDKFNCVNPQNMKSIIIVFKDDNKWILYGVGAVKAPSVFFLRERVDTSFMNRIKTFCSYFFSKIDNR